jgi:hypothetical protein
VIDNQTRSRRGLTTGVRVHCPGHDFAVTIEIEADSARLAAAQLYSSYCPAFGLAQREQPNKLGCSRSAQLGSG